MISKRYLQYSTSIENESFAFIGALRSYLPHVTLRLCFPSLQTEEVCSTRRSCATLWSFRVINGRTLSNNKLNLCLTIKIVLLDVMSNNMNKTFGRKPDKETFWLLLWIWTKVTRPAGRNKGLEYKAFEWSLNSASGKAATYSRA